MRNVAGLAFPTTHEELLAWKPLQLRTVLHRQVMAVARTRAEGAWACYVFPVPGQNHDQEEHLWEREGCKQREDIARALFPHIPAELPYSV